MQQHLSSDGLKGKFDIEPISKIIMEKHLHWLGHVGRMNENRLPQITLYGEMKKKRPPYSAKKHWKDLVSVDLQILN